MSERSNVSGADVGVPPAGSADFRRFRKKPVEITAVRLHWSNVAQAAAWCGGRLVESVKPSDPSDVAHRVDIPTLEGTMRASMGDWIIRGVKGEFYPCKPDIFAATYDEVTA